jgi:hypothetical protein
MIKEDEIGGEYSTLKRNKKCIQNFTLKFWGGNIFNTCCLKDKEVDEKKGL